MKFRGSCRRGCRPLAAGASTSDITVETLFQLAICFLVGLKSFFTDLKALLQSQYNRLWVKRSHDTGVIGGLFQFDGDVAYVVLRSEPYCFEP